MLPSALRCCHLQQNRLMGLDALGQLDLIEGAEARGLGEDTMMFIEECGFGCMPYN